METQYPTLIFTRLPGWRIRRHWSTLRAQLSRLTSPVPLPRSVEAAAVPAAETGARVKANWIELRAGARGESRAVLQLMIDISRRSVHSAVLCQSWHGTGQDGRLESISMSQRAAVVLFHLLQACADHTASTMREPRQMLGYALIQRAVRMLAAALGMSAPVQS